MEVPQLWYCKMGKEEELVRLLKRNGLSVQYWVFQLSQKVPK